MRNRGVGLSCIRRLVDANSGYFEIWSGNGVFTNDQEAATLITNHWTGTLLTVNMQRSTSTADFRAVMEQLTDELRSVERASKQK
jgi:hypothetical protein